MIFALVPVKELSEAKARLRPLLDGEQRRALSLAMLQDVLAALRQVSGLQATAVVSRDEAALALARHLGALAIAEPRDLGGLNEALTYASDLLQRQGAQGVLVVPADMPGAQPAEIEELLAAAGARPQVVLSPSRDGGTNALLRCPPDVIPPRFGPRSAAAHRREAEARGVPFRLLRLPSLALDIDGPSDLRRFAAMGHRCHAYQWLQEAGILGTVSEVS